MSKVERKEVFTVIDRENEKAWWVRVGTAFVNRDGSWNVILDALPVNGKLQIRDPLPANSARDDERGRSESHERESDRTATRGHFQGGSDSGRGRT